MKLYLEINLSVSENSFCSVSDHFHDCNIIDSWIFLKYTYSIESYKFNNKLDCSLRICNEMTNDQIQRINYFFFFYFEKHLMFLQYFYFSPCLSSFFFFHQDYTYSSENEKLSSFRQLFFANKYCVKSDHSQSSIQ